MPFSPWVFPCRRRQAHDELKSKFIVTTGAAKFAMRKQNSHLVSRRFGSAVLVATVNAFLTVGFSVLLGQAHDELKGKFIVATSAIFDNSRIDLSAGGSAARCVEGLRLSTPTTCCLMGLLLPSTGAQPLFAKRHPGGKAQPFRTSGGKATTPGLFVCLVKRNTILPCTILTLS
jgi:hypothetical protein